MKREHSTSTGQVSRGWSPQRSRPAAQKKPSSLVAAVVWLALGVAIGASAAAQTPLETLGR